MIRIIWGLFALTIFLFADKIPAYSYKNYCIDSYYYKNGYIYYHRLDRDDWYRTSSKSYPEPFKGYVYDTDDQNCSLNIKGGLYVNEYNFLMALAGLLSGFALIQVVLLIFKGV